MTSTPNFKREIDFCDKAIDRLGTRNGDFGLLSLVIDRGSAVVIKQANRVRLNCRLDGEVSQAVILEDGTSTGDVQLVIAKIAEVVQHKLSSLY